MHTIDFNKIIEHQVRLILEEKGLRPDHLTHLEYLQMKYDMALKLLGEL